MSDDIRDLTPASGRPDPGDDPRYELLRRHLDGELEGAEADAATALLADDEQARAWADDHARLWSALGEPDVVSEDMLPSPSWRARTVEAARDEVPAAPILRARWVAALAAAVLLALAVTNWFDQEPSPLNDIPAGDRDIVRYLHVIQGMDLLERYGQELDLRGDYEVFRAFEGELEGEG